jgi:hypothetical protein
MDEIQNQDLQSSEGKRTKMPKEFIMGSIKD